MILFALQGGAGCGKTTFANHLAKHHGFVQYSFADPLKDMCADLFGWNRGRLDELAYKEEQDPDLPPGWTRRKVLQFAGTEFGRVIDAEFWIKKGKRRLEFLKNRDRNDLLLTPDGLIEPPSGVVIPDCRFVNEAAAIRELGGFIIRLRRPGFVGTELNQHVSEQEWQNVEPDLDLAPAEGRAAVERAADMALAWARDHSSSPVSGR